MLGFAQHRRHCPGEGLGLACRHPAWIVFPVWEKGSLVRSSDLRVVRLMPEEVGHWRQWSAWYCCSDSEVPYRAIMRDNGVPAP